MNYSYHLNLISSHLIMFIHLSASPDCVMYRVSTIHHKYLRLPPSFPGTLAYQDRRTEGGVCAGKRRPRGDNPPGCG